MPTPRPFRVTLVSFALLALLAVVMSGAGVAATQSLTFTPTDDTEANSEDPAANRGSKPEGRVDGEPVRRTFVRFDVSGLTAPVSRATLRLYSRTAHSMGFEVRSVSSEWAEETLTHENAPAPSANVTGTSGPIAAGTWEAIDVTPLVSGNGAVAFALTTTSVTNLPLAMKEIGDTLAPQLVIETSESTNTPPPSSPPADTTPPSAPSSLTKTAGTESQVSLSWGASTDNVGVTGYGVYRDGTLVGETTTATTYAVNNLSCGRSYEFAVDARDAAGNRSAKTTLTAATNSCPAPAPGSPPADTTAPTTPSTLTKSGSTEMQVSLSWSASTDNVGVTGYGVYRDGTLVGSTTTQTTYTVTGLSCGRSYEFAVDAQDAAGNRSAKRLLNASTNACPPAPAPAPSGSNLSLPARAVFYYPWFPETWTVNGAHVKYHPALGYYSSSDAAVAQSHVRQLQYGGFNAAIASWWGPGTHAESTRLPLLLDTTASLGSSLKWALYHEMEGQGNPTVASLQSDLSYLASKYGSHASYARIGGKPVIFVYNANDSSCEVVDRWKQAAAGNWYVVLKLFPGYRNCPNQPDSWHQYAPANAVQSHLPDSYNISPGFWRADEASPRLARDLNRWQQNVRDMVASGARWQLVTSFNEWGEGTAVENAQEWASASGYGAYLDALNANGGSAPPPPPPSSDTSPPTAPTGLAATGATTSSISVSWNASTDNVGVTGYGVYVDGALVASTSQRSYTVSNRACGKSYVVAVDAYDAAGNRSAKSAALTVATSMCPVSDTQAPTTPASLRATSATQTSVAVAWNASTDNVGVTGYNVYRNGTFVATTSATSHNFTGLNCATSYTFGVEALDAAGNKSTRASLTVATAACPVSGSDPVIAVAGDIAGDGSGDSATAALLDSLAPTAVLTTGDNAYPDGTLAEFNSYYDPTWGRHKSRTYPSAGNHDYLTSGASGYFTYFGARAGPSGKGYYSFDIGNWHLIAINSNCSPAGGCGVGSPQYTWLRDDLAASTKPCTAAYWHHPTFAAGQYSDRTDTVPIWNLLYNAGVELVLNGHDHNYQRYYPMRPDGTRDDARGVQEIIVGTGGRSHYSISRTDSRRAVANGDTYGVLKLTLRSSSYDWQFVPESGRTFTDSGTRNCH